MNPSAVEDETPKRIAMRGVPEDISSLDDEVLPSTRPVGSSARTAPHPAAASGADDNRRRSSKRWLIASGMARSFLGGENPYKVAFRIFFYIFQEHIDMSNKALPLSPVLMSTHPVWASSNEEVPGNEDAATQQIVRMIEETVRAEAKNASARRGAHAKAHGCVQAEFRVLDNLPDEVRVGIFGEARAYPAWIRYSNAFGKVQDDSVGDGRGMAIKLMGVELSNSGTQDFLMISHPVFFVRNAANYAEFQKALSEDSPVKFFFPGLNPFNFRLHEFKIAKAILSTKVANPLDTRYWSTTPYRFGGDTAMKFSARPCGTASSFVERPPPLISCAIICKSISPRAKRALTFWSSYASVPRKCPSRIPRSNGAKRTRPSSLWRGSQFQFRSSPRPSNWSSARTSLSRPGTRSTSINL